MREQDWVAWLSRQAPRGPYEQLLHESNRCGLLASDLIGDDAAALPMKGSDTRSLICADMIVDGVHFLSHSTPADLIGRKALAVNLSDIAAMGGQPLHAVVTISIPHALEWTFVEQLYQGLFAMARQHNVAIVGGDTTRWPHPLTLSVTVCGMAGPSLWRRAGANVGDQLFVSGDLGGSLTGKHLRFVPRLDLAEWLQRQPIAVNAAIDISDGLGIDLGRVCDASHCGVRLRADAIPISSAAISQAATSGKTPLEHALGDGEDFELLLAVPPDAARQLRQNQPPVPLTWIGEITPPSDRVMVDASGAETPLPACGYDHLADEN